MSAPTLGIEPLGTSVRETGELAAAADQAGLAAVWTPEIHSRSATITLAEMAARTTRCAIGSAIAYGAGRSPLTLAAEARDLDELSDGRLILGLGNGTRRMLSDWLGVDPSAPAARMEELVPLVRRLWRLHEEPVHHDGRFYRVHITPTGDVVPPVRERIPIYTAGVNPRMVETAGRVADGLLGHPLSTVRYIEDVVLPAIERGAERAGRSPGEIEVANLILAFIHDDPEQARREAAAQIAFYCSVKTYDHVLEVNGFAGEAATIREAFARRDIRAMIDAVTDRMIDAIALAGTAEDVRSGMARYEGLLDHVILYAPNFEIPQERAIENARALIDHCGVASRR